MDEFPQSINTTETSSFVDVLFKENLRTLRKKLYLHILRENESDFYDIDAFNRKYVNNINETKKMVNIVVQELTSMGWKTFLGFGETGLYIFKNEKPVNAY